MYHHIVIFRFQLILILLFGIFVGWHISSVSPVLHTSHSVLPCVHNNSSGNSGSDTTDNVTTSTVAVLVQCGQNVNIDLIISCISNIVAAKELIPFKMDVFISFVDTFDRGVEEKILSRLRILLTGPDSVYHHHHINAGFDVGPFIKQLKHTIIIGKRYEYIFKIHTKSNREWLQHCVECLCGSKAQVVSILRDFMTTSRPIHEYEHEHAPNMIAAQGTVFGSLSDRSKVAPFLLRQLFRKQELWLAFEDHVLVGMDKLYERLFSRNVHFTREDAIIVAGTVFWVRFSELCAEQLVDALSWLQQSLTTRYIQDGGIEHILERLIPSMIEKKNKDKNSLHMAVREMISTPRPILITYPEMTDFQDMGHGFNIDHIVGIVHTYYWCAPSNTCRYSSNTVISRQLQMPFLNGNLSFMLALAWGPVRSGHLSLPRNGSFSDRRTAATSFHLGTEIDWRKHFFHILPLLRHPNYILADGVPMFIIHSARFKKIKLFKLMSFWVELAKEKGLRGIYFIALLDESEPDGGNKPEIRSSDKSPDRISRSEKDRNISGTFQATLEIVPLSLTSSSTMNDTLNDIITSTSTDLSVSKRGEIVKVAMYSWYSH